MVAAMDGKRHVKPSPYRPILVVDLSVCDHVGPVRRIQVAMVASAAVDARNQPSTAARSKGFVGLMDTLIAGGLR
jgi:hypothetical protein